MENPLPDLGIELLKQHPKGTFLYFENFSVGLVTFTNQEYISVTAKVFLNIPALATFIKSLKSELKTLLKKNKTVSTIKSEDSDI